MILETSAGAGATGGLTSQMAHDIISSQLEDQHFRRALP
jgi:hypothetical protein